MTTLKEEKMTSGERRAIVRVFENVLDASNLTNSQAQSILIQGNKLKAWNQSIIKELAISTKDKFKELKSLGILTVPNDYNFESYLYRFGESHHPEHTIPRWYKRLGPRVSPGEKFLIRLFEQTVEHDTIYEERMALLAMENATLLGLNGILLLADHGYPNSRELYGYCYTSMAKRKYLNDDRVPGINTLHFSEESDHYPEERYGAFPASGEFPKKALILCFNRI